MSEHTAPIDPETLLRIRESRGWSQYVFAELLGVSRSTVSRMECGRVRINRCVRHLVRLLDNLGGTPTRKLLLMVQTLHANRRNGD
jgi:transcriptional regulator with XRE-family HTH domain